MDGEAGGSRLLDFFSVSAGRAASRPSFTGLPASGRKVGGLSGRWPLIAAREQFPMGAGDRFPRVDRLADPVRRQGNSGDVLD
jgi:hypothetical protein